MSIVQPPALQIYACGDFYQDASELNLDLRQLTQQATGKSIRRISRFIQLALIGAGRCAHGRTHGQGLPADTGVYFSSGRGDLDVTVDIMKQLFVDAQTPKPLAFVNTVSNASCFYVAQTFGLHSRSNYVCNQYFAFESALQLAALDVQLGVLDSTLIGSVDVATHPLHEHRQRLQLSDDTNLGEGSHWLWAGASRADRPRIGEVAIASLASQQALMKWITHLLTNIENDCALAAGQFLSEDHFRAIQQTTGLQRVFHYRAQRGYYDSQSGAVIHNFLQHGTTEALLHVNRDPDDRYAVMLVRR